MEEDEVGCEFDAVFFVGNRLYDASMNFVTKPPSLEFFFLGVIASCRLHGALTKIQKPLE